MITLRIKARVDGVRAIRTQETRLYLIVLASVPWNPSRESAGVRSRICIMAILCACMQQVIRISDEAQTSMATRLSMLLVLVLICSGGYQILALAQSKLVIII